jgi:hypothetical protein
VIVLGFVRANPPAQGTRSTDRLRSRRSRDCAYDVAPRARFVLRMWRRRRESNAVYAVLQSPPERASTSADVRDPCSIPGVVRGSVRRRCYQPLLLERGYAAVAAKPPAQRGVLPSNATRAPTLAAMPLSVKTYRLIAASSMTL